LVAETTSRRLLNYGLSADQVAALGWLEPSGRPSRKASPTSSAMEHGVRWHHRQVGDAGMKPTHRSRIARSLV
ncbi:MAG TPA: hypothetical protein VMF65_10210, partial [Acidimicrobiales bacterium]|nr:hypothetical protein [Acidimicrobiales bacterium]